MTTPRNPTFGAGVLRYPEIMSPNFDLANPSASPANSWALLQSGLAYLFGVVLTGGTITGPDYIINTNGAFFYSGTPAAGNLTGSVTSFAGVDGFGNGYKAGFTVYGKSGGYVNLVSFVGQAIIGLLADGVTHIGIVPQLEAGVANTGAANEIQQMLIRSGGPDASTARTTALLLEGEAADGSLPGLIKLFTGNDNAVTIFPTSMIVRPPITKSDPADSTGGTAETWHSPSLGAGMTGGLKYKLNPDNTVSLRGNVITNANTAAGATVFTLPVNYRPNVAFGFLTPNNMSGYVAPARSVTVSTGGVVALGPAATSGNFCLIDNIRFPVD